MPCAMSHGQPYTKLQHVNIEGTRGMRIFVSQRKMIVKTVRLCLSEIHKAKFLEDGLSVFRTLKARRYC
jgi:hypothetical protein